MYGILVEMVLVLYRSILAAFSVMCTKNFQMCKLGLEKE